MGFRVVDWLPQVAEQLLDELRRTAVPLHLALLDTHERILDERQLDLAAVAWARRVLWRGDELGTAQVQAALARPLLRQSQAVAEFELRLEEVVLSQSTADGGNMPARRVSAAGPAMIAPGPSTA